MKAYLFQGSDGHFALLSTDSLDRLPEEFGPWKKWSHMEIRPGDPDQLGIPTAMALENLETLGSHCFQLKVTIE